MQENRFFTVKMVKALTQVAQRGGGVSILGGIKNVTGNRPEQCALFGPALSRETGLNDLQKSLPTSTILWLSLNEILYLWGFFGLSTFPSGKEKVLEGPYLYVISKVTVFQIVTSTLFGSEYRQNKLTPAYKLEAATFLLAWYWVKANKHCWEGRVLWVGLGTVLSRLCGFSLSWRAACSMPYRQIMCAGEERQVLLQKLKFLDLRFKLLGPIKYL